jgi:hypothetical protein
LVEYPVKKSQFEELMETFKGEEQTKAVLEAELGEFYQFHKILKQMSHTSGIQTRLPFQMVIE